MDGTRTVAWDADDVALAADGVVLEGAAATLVWQDRSIAWRGGTDFTGNGTLSPTLTSSAEGLELRADPTNYVAAGDFSQSGPWQFTNGSDGATNASWDAATETATISHASAQVPRVPWDSMDSIDPNWTIDGSVLSTSAISQFLADHGDGSGMMRDDVATGPGTTAWAGASRAGVFNWSDYDRLLLWILAPSDLAPGIATFNLSAHLGTGILHTSPIPLGPDWTELAIDLAELGPGRSSISRVTLRINGPSIRETFYFDDLRLTRAKTETAQAVISQTIVKANVTPAVAGSAVLSFDWAVRSSANVETFQVTVNMTAPSGTYEALAASRMATGRGSVWFDASSWMQATGGYDIRLAVRMLLNTTYESGIELAVDNATVRLPDRTSGTFTSRVVDFGGRVETVSLSWNASLAAQGWQRVALRSGPAPAPDGSWGPWWETTSPGEYAVADRASYFQLRATLGTANASATPIVEQLSLSVRHRAATGTLATPLFEPDTDFARWRNVIWTGTTGPHGSLAFEVGNGTGWNIVTVASNLAAFPASLQLRVSLLTSDLLESPALSSFGIVYEVVRNPGQIWDWATGNPWALGAMVAAAGALSLYAAASRQLFAIEDVFLVARDGRLIMHNTRRIRAQWDEDTFAGMLTAISAFVRDSFRDERGELNRFEFSGKTVLIERVDSMYVAALYAGRVPGRALRNLKSFVADLEARYGEQLRSWSGSPEDLLDLKALTKRFVGRGRYRGSDASDAAG